MMRFSRSLSVFLLLALWAALSSASAAAQAPKLRLDDVVNNAKKEGKVRFGFSASNKDMKPMMDAFHKRYPFIKLEYNRFRGIEEAEKAMNELLAGVANIDLFDLKPELWLRFKRGNLVAGPFDWVSLGVKHPKVVIYEGHGVALGGMQFGVVYNPSLVPAGKVPKRWEDCLDPQWKGKKMGVDTRPASFLPLHHYWGEEKSIAYHKRLAAQEPIWKRGQSDVMQNIAAGEVALLCGAYYGSAMRLKRDDPTAKLEFAFLDVVPARGAFDFAAIPKLSANQNAAMLLASFLATEGQTLYEKQLFFPNPYLLGPEVRAKVGNRPVHAVIPYVDIDYDSATKKIVEAWGFPTSGK
jgi:ABC-type Fe3+ transport system substrate-binding protein